MKESLLPLGVFTAVLVFHYLWLGLFPEQDPAQARWAALPPEGAAAWLPNYVGTQGYWLGSANRTNPLIQRTTLHPDSVHAFRKRKIN